MKNGIFPGILLIGIGCYFLLKQLNFPFLHAAFTWPTLLIIIGIAFIAQAYLANEYNSIVPGVVLTGLGVHFHAQHYIPFWPDHWAVYTLIVSLALLLKYYKTKNGLVVGIILLVISLLGLFYDGFISWMNWIGELVGWIEKFWPAALIIFGLYLLFFGRKK